MTSGVGKEDGESIARQHNIVAIQLKRANFSGFIRLFTKKGYGQRKMRTLLKLIVWALCKSEILWKKITKSCVLKSTKQWESIYSIN